MLLDMRQANRCGAKTRSGNPCRSPAVRNRKRCRMHGGAAGSGAPPGNANALKHGRHCKAIVEERRRFRELVREAEETLAAMRR